MLAITANWRLTDGSLAGSGAGRAAAWLDAIRRAVVRAGCGRDGRYRPVDGVCLVFAGDTLDWLLSDSWRSGDRPWHGGERGQRARLRAASRLLRVTRPAVRQLATWGRRGLTVPAADGRGRPSTWAGHPVPVRPVLLAGDRDWWILEWAEQLGRLGIAVGEEWSDGALRIRHGHDCDPLAWGPPSISLTGERQPTLAESVAVDLLVPFAVAVREEARWWPMLRPAVPRFATAHPATWPGLVAELVAAVGGDAQAAAWLRSIWQRSVSGWVAAARRETPACDAEFDAVGELAGWLARPAAEQQAPPAILRLTAMLDGRWPMTADTNSHHHAADSPTLTCQTDDGRTWRERLDGPARSAAVVTIGAAAAGSGFVDAA